MHGDSQTTPGHDDGCELSPRSHRCWWIRLESQYGGTRRASRQLPVDFIAVTALPVEGERPFVPAKPRVSPSESEPRAKTDGIPR